MSCAVAAEMLLTGNVISVDRARAVGFVNRVVEAEAVLATATEIARDNCRECTVGDCCCRDLLRTSFDQTEAEALEHEATSSVRLAKSADAVEGPRAFLEKRSPVFRGG